MDAACGAGTGSQKPLCWINPYYVVEDRDGVWGGSMEEGPGLGAHRLGTHDLAGLRTGFILALKFGTGMLPDTREETEGQRG